MPRHFKTADNHDGCARFERAGEAGTIDKNWYFCPFCGARIFSTFKPLLNERQIEGRELLARLKELL